MLSDVDLSKYTSLHPNAKVVQTYINSLYHLPPTSSKFPGAMVAGLEWSDLNLFDGIVTSHIPYKASEIISWISPPIIKIAPSPNATPQKRVVKPKPKPSVKSPNAPSIPTIPLPPTNHALQSLVETIDFGSSLESGFAATFYE